MMPDSSGEWWQSYWWSQGWHCSHGRWCTKQQFRRCCSMGVKRGGDGCNFICSKGFSSSCGQKSCRKYSSACWVKRVVMAISGRISGGGRAVAHQGIHSEVAKHNCDAHLQLAHIWNIHRVVKDAGMQQLHDMVGSRLGTGGKVTWRVVWFKNNCEEVGALIHTTWCPNVQVVEG